MLFLKKQNIRERKMTKNADNLLTNELFKLKTGCMQEEARF